MKLYCRISGLPILASSAFGKLWKEYSTEHPIFKLPATRLWKLAAAQSSTDLQWRKLSADERKLLTLAVLNSTGLVIWKAPAQITEQFADQYYPRIYQFASWKHHLLRPTHFPKFVVDGDTQSLESLPGWLSECEDIRLAEFQSLTRREQQLRQQSIDEKFSLLQKQSRLSKGAKTRYLNKLADWMLATAEVPDKEVTVESGSKKEIKLHDFVRKIFLVADEDVSRVHADDIEYLREYFALKLPLGSISSFAVQERFKEIEEAKQRELNSFELLDMLLLDDPVADGVASSSPSGSSTSTVTTTASTTTLASSTTSTEIVEAAPQLHQFATPFAYHVALQAWKQKHRAGL